MNGLCPACRRRYDDSTVQWKQISPEELASYRESQAQQAKRKAAARQKEMQKREADTLSRKHLAGIRVRQKNLVYVTGLAPTANENQLAEQLRTPEYFGQYGKIIKVVVSKGRDSAHNHQSVGVYITYARKEEAAQCIAAVDGHVNGDVRLRYGVSTKTRSGAKLTVTGHNTGPPSTAQPIYEMKFVTTKAACSSMNLARRMRVLHARICPP